MLVAELHEEFVGAGARLLHAAEEIAGLAGVRRLEGLPQHDLVVVAAPHALADLLHVGHVFFGRVVADDGAAFARRRRRHRRPSRASPWVRAALAAELVLVALDLLFLAVHQPDVVAEEEMQIFVPGARQFLFDGLELEEQVVTEGADQREVRVFLALELLDQRAQNRERGGLLAALLLGEERGQGLEAAGQNRAFEAELFPVRMVREQLVKHAGEDGSALVQRPELHAAVVGNNFERRAGRGDIPARISSGILISRRKINPAVLVQVIQQVVQSLPEVDLGRGPGDLDTVGSGIAVFAHKHFPLEVDFQNSMRARISPPRRAACLRSWPAPGTSMMSTRAGMAATAARNSSGVPKGSRAPWTKSAGVRHCGEIGGAQLLRLLGGMQRVGEQQQSVGELGPLGGEHGGLPPAVGVPAGEDAPRRQLADFGHGFGDAFAVAGLPGGEGRAAGAQHAEGEVVAQDGHSQFAEGARQGRQQGRVAVGPGAVSERQSVAVGVFRYVQHAAHLAGVKDAAPDP